MTNSNNAPIVIYQEIFDIIKRLERIQNDGIGTVFFDMSGHVQAFNVRIYKGSWVSGYDPDYTDFVYIERMDDNRENVLNFQNRLYKFLDSLTVNVAP